MPGYRPKRDCGLRPSRTWGLTEATLERMKGKARRQTDAAINDRVQERTEQSKGLTGVFLDMSIA